MPTPPDPRRAGDKKQLRRRPGSSRAAVPEDRNALRARPSPAGSRPEGTRRVALLPRGRRRAGHRATDRGAARPWRRGDRADHPRRLLARLGGLHRSPTSSPTAGSACASRPAHASAPRPSAPPTWCSCQGCRWTPRVAGSVRGPAATTAALPYVSASTPVLAVVFPDERARRAAAGGAPRPKSRRRPPLTALRRGRGADPRSSRRERPASRPRRPPTASGVNGHGYVSPVSPRVDLVGVVRVEHVTALAGEVDPP